MSNGGRIYFIRPVGMAGPIKIGCAGVPEERVKMLATWSPFPLEVVASVPGGFLLEKNIHECFADAHSHREWFLPIPRLVEAVAKLAAGVPLDEAINLDGRVGSLARKKYDTSSWTAARRVAQSIISKLYWAGRRAAKLTGEDRQFAPPDVRGLMFAASDRVLTDAEMARIEEVIRDPAAHFLTHEEYLAARQKKAA